MKKILPAFISFVLLYGQNTQALEKKLSARGKKIAEIFCNKKLLPKYSGDLNSTIEAIKSSKACSKTDAKSLKAVAFFIKNGSPKTVKSFKVPKDAKCPVCGMFVHKYPKWAALMEIEGKNYYFDGVKDMLKFYFYDADFKYDRSKISKVLVRDYYTLESIDARDAFYVTGSNIYGPMGNEFIPFKTKKEAMTFLNDHKGEKIVKFKDITFEMVENLDKKQQ